MEVPKGEKRPSIGLPLLSCRSKDVIFIGVYLRGSSRTRMRPVLRIRVRDLQFILDSTNDLRQAIRGVIGRILRIMRDFTSVLNELRAERNRIDSAIQAIE